MNNILLALSIFIMVSCSRQSEDIRREIKKLEGVEAEQKQQISILNAQRIELEQKVDELKFKYHVQQGGSVRYTLTLKVEKQPKISTDPNAMFENMMEDKFKIDVSREFFNRVKIGKKISDGDFIVKVADKQKILVD